MCFGLLVRLVCLEGRIRFSGQQLLKLKVAILLISYILLEARSFVGQKRFILLKVIVRFLFFSPEMDQHDLVIQIAMCMRLRLFLAICPF